MRRTLVSVHAGIHAGRDFVVMHDDNKLARAHAIIRVARQFGITWNVEPHEVWSVCAVGTWDPLTNAIVDEPGPR